MSFSPTAEVLQALSPVKTARAKIESGLQRQGQEQLKTRSSSVDSQSSNNIKDKIVASPSRADESTFATPVSGKGHRIRPSFCLPPSSSFVAKVEGGISDKKGLADDEIICPSSAPRGLRSMMQRSASTMSSSSTPGVHVVKRASSTTLFAYNSESDEDGVDAKQRQRLSVKDHILTLERKVAVTKTPDDIGRISMISNDEDPPHSPERAVRRFSSPLARSKSLSMNSASVESDTVRNSTNSPSRRVSSQATKSPPATMNKDSGDCQVEPKTSSASKAFSLPSASLRADDVASETDVKIKSTAVPASGDSDARAKRTILSIVPDVKETTDREGSKPRRTPPVRRQSTSPRFSLVLAENPSPENAATRKSSSRTKYNTGFEPPMNVKAGYTASRQTIDTGTDTMSIQPEVMKEETRVSTTETQATTNEDLVSAMQLLRDALQTMKLQQKDNNTNTPSGKDDSATSYGAQEELVIMAVVNLLRDSVAPHKGPSDKKMKAQASNRVVQLAAARALLSTIPPSHPAVNILTALLSTLEENEQSTSTPLTLEAEQGSRNFAGKKEEEQVRQDRISTHMFRPDDGEEPVREMNSAKKLRAASNLPLIAHTTSEERGDHTDATSVSSAQNDDDMVDYRERERSRSPRPSRHRLHHSSAPPKSSRRYSADADRNGIDSRRKRISNNDYRQNEVSTSRPRSSRYSSSSRRRELDFIAGCLYERERRDKEERPFGRRDNRGSVRSRERYRSGSRRSGRGVIEESPKVRDMRSHSPRAERRHRSPSPRYDNSTWTHIDSRSPAGDGRDFLTKLYEKQRNIYQQISRTSTMGSDSAERHEHAFADSHLTVRSCDSEVFPWSCPVCTLENPPTYLRCGACGVIKITALSSEV